MLQPRLSRLSSLVKSPLVRQSLPTGNGFGGSSLNIIPAQSLVFSIVGDSVLMPEDTSPISIQQPSVLVLEVGKIVLLAVWFWCLIGANFCLDRINAISCACAQDI